MELQSIVQELHQSSKRLEEGSKDIFLLAKAMAESEREYRKALTIEIVMLKEQGMSVTLINEIARGSTADLKFERDLAEAKYTAARDSLKAIAVQVSALQTILKIQDQV